MTPYEYNSMSYHFKMMMMMMMMMTNNEVSVQRYGLRMGIVRTT
jgi:hypothetical protein